LLFDLFTALLNFSDIVCGCHILLVVIIGKHVFTPHSVVWGCWVNLTIEQIDWNLVILMIYVLFRLDLLRGDYSLCSQNAWSQIILQAGLFELMWKVLALN